MFVPYDQLSDRIGPLSREDPRELGIVLIDIARDGAIVNAMVAERLGAKAGGAAKAERYVSL